MSERILSDEMREHLEREHGNRTLEVSRALWNNTTDTLEEIYKAACVGQCKGCKWWDAKDRFLDGFGSLWSDCQQEQTRKKTLHNLRTKDSFGCIHFQKREE